MYPANRTNRASLRMLGPDGTPLARRYYSQKTGRDLDDDEMIRGYEIEKDKYVEITDEELERLAPKKTRDIDLRRFVNKDQIPPLYFERAYFLAPSGNSDKAYRLLAQTMEEGDQAGIATFVMRGKEYLVAILAENGIMRAETLRFPDEVRTPDDIELPAKGKVPNATVRKFEGIVKKHTKQRLSKNELRDDQTERVVDLAERKRSRGEDVVEVEEAAAGDGKVIDIMEVLKKSLARKR